MTNEEKSLLLIDLCARLPYGVQCEIGGLRYGPYTFTGDDVGDLIDGRTFKPYLRPMSSMTDEERKEYESFIFTQHHEWDGHGTSTKYVEVDDAERYVTWLLSHHFDFRGLIPMGLALEATEGMYK